MTHWDTLNKENSNLVAFFNMSHCVICSPVWRFCTTWLLSCKRPIWLLLTCFMAVFLFHEKQETLTLNIPRQASHSQPMHTPQSLTLGASMAVYVSPGGTWYPSVYSLKWWISASMDSYNDVNTPEYLLKNSTGKATTRSFSMEETYFHFRSLRWRDFCIIYFDFAWRHLVQALEWNQKRSWEFEHLHQPRARFKPTPTVRRHFPALDADYTYTVFSCNSDWFLWITESTVIGVIAFSRAWRWLHVHCVFLQLWLVPLNQWIYCDWRNWKLNFQVRK